MSHILLNTNDSPQPATLLGLQTNPGGALSVNCPWRLSNDTATSVPAVNKHKHFTGFAGGGFTSINIDPFDQVALARQPRVGLAGIGNTLLQKVNPLIATSSIPNSDSSAENLRPKQIEKVLAAAVEIWRGRGADTTNLDSLRVDIQDLDGASLGHALHNTIWIDQNAAGHGWYVDETPFDNREFEVSTGLEERRATAESPAFGLFDLLTVLEHEIGHILGVSDHVDGSHNSEELMATFLRPGSRRFPSMDDLASLKADVTRVDEVTRLTTFTHDVSVAHLGTGEHFASDDSFSWRDAAMAFDLLESLQLDSEIAANMIASPSIEQSNVRMNASPVDKRVNAWKSLKFGYDSPKFFIERPYDHNRLRNMAALDSIEFDTLITLLAQDRHRLSSLGYLHPLSSNL